MNNTQTLSSGAAQKIQFKDSSRGRLVVEAAIRVWAMAALRLGIQMYMGRLCHSILRLIEAWNTDKGTDG